MIEFGTKLKNKRYAQRPGAYAVILNEEGLVGVVKNPKGYFLLGGGIEGGETPEQALHRECKEEIGMSLRIERKIGVATQHLYVPEIDLYLSKEGHFYEATLLTLVDENSEDNHEFHWLSVSEALEKLHHQSHRWALEEHLSLGL